MSDNLRVHTVLGEIEPSALGRTLMHEHIFCDLYRVTGRLNELLNDEALAVEELAALRKAGGTALVEVTTPDMGRDPEALCRIAEKTELHIIMGTGWYRQPFYPPDIDRLLTNELADRIISELTDGVSGTGIRAGVIGEIGIHLDYATAQEERVLRAAARAQKATGAPLTTHASMYPVGLQQLEVLKDEGVDMSRVIIGHCDTYLDQSYHLAILESGAYVQFDTVGRNHMNPDSRRASAFAELARLGWKHKLLLSSDRCHRSDLRAFGGLGYGYVFTGFFDLLRARGVDDETLDAITIENPRRVLAW
ncbi:MAG: phosphotriesterase-related protein [Chloroflexota bacterium]|nr:phosphotriesterase-related protein [Chloroflexota bacterium]